MRTIVAGMVVLALLLMGCRPGTSAEVLAGTYVAATQAFVAAVEDGIATGIAATLTSAPTNTPTVTPSSTPRPTNTPTATVTPTAVPTETSIPTETGTPEPTTTSTPSAADIKAGQLIAALRNMKVLAERLYSGLGGTGTGYTACSRELSDSIVVARDAVRNLPTFDDSLLSSRLVGANINYNLALKAILESGDIQMAYTNCVNWLAAGKPPEGSSAVGEGVNFDAARSAANQAIRLAEAGLNN